MCSNTYEPIYYKDQLIIGNPASAVAVTTLWSKKEKIAEAIPSSLFAVMGQLYSPMRGLDPLVRNLLANPGIRHLVVTGRDFAGSGRALQDFFLAGVVRGRTSLGQECWLVKSTVEALVDIEVDKDAIDALRAGVTLHVVKPDELKTKLLALADEKASAYGEPRVFEKKEHKPQVLPAAEVVHEIRGAKVAVVWLQILDRIMRFGRVGRTHYGTSQKEILDLVAVVDQEDPDDFYIPDYLPMNRRHLDEYFPRVLTGREYPDTEYTYGQRLRTHFGVDQIDAMIEKLVADQDRRSAAAVLWDPRVDNAGRSAPCVNHLWARIREGKVYLTVVIRSNDMYSAWPENAFALRRLQEIIRSEVARRSGATLALGVLVTLSESAHVYSDCWADAEEVVARNYSKEVPPGHLVRDPAGGFVIDVRDGRIVCEHISPAGEHVSTYEGKTAGFIANRLARDGAVSNIGHAIYVGRELARAEAALANADVLKYTQDRQLERKD